MFDSSCQKEFFKQNFGYTLLSQQTISENLLDIYYISFKDNISYQLSLSSSLYLIINKSTNISKNKIINTLIVLPFSKFFYQLNIKAPPSKIKAKELIDYIYKTIKEITNSQLLKINLIIIDICLTIIALYKFLEKTLSIKYIFIVPCNSYSL